MSIRGWKVAVWSQVMLVLVGWSASASGADATRPAAEAVVKQYWAAEVARDYDTVWTLSSMRQQISDPKESYVKIRNEKGPINILKADVQKVDVSGDLAWAYVKYDWVVANFPGYPTRKAERWQPWRYQDRWYPLATSEVEEWPTLPPSLRPVAEEAVIKARVEEMWKARVSGDMKAIYAFMSPPFKAVVPIEQFAGAKKPKYIYTAATVEWVEGITGADQARARIKYLYRENEVAMSKMKPLETSAIEPWIKVDGAWYIDSLVPDVPAAQETDPTKQAATQGSAK